MACTGYFIQLEWNWNAITYTAIAKCSGRSTQKVIIYTHSWNTTVNYHGDGHDQQQLQRQDFTMMQLVYAAWYGLSELEKTTKSLWTSKNQLWGKFILPPQNTIAYVMRI